MSDDTVLVVLVLVLIVSLASAGFSYYNLQSSQECYKIPPSQPCWDIQNNQIQIENSMNSPSDYDIFFNLNKSVDRLVSKYSGKDLERCK